MLTSIEVNRACLSEILGDKALLRSANILQIADTRELSSCCSMFLDNSSP